MYNTPNMVVLGRSDYVEVTTGSVCENRKRISELGLDQSKLQSDLYNEKSVSTDISDLKVFFPQLFKLIR